MRRRDFFQGVLLSGAAITAARQVGARPLADSWAFRDAAEVLPLLAPLCIGDEVGLGFRLEDVTGVQAGASVLTLRRGSQFFRVHLCLRDGGPRGLAHTEALDFLLMNDGDGNHLTEERLARVVNVLASLVRKNEQAGAPTPKGLLSHATRAESFASCGKLV